MKLFVVFAAFFAIASAGLLPHRRSPHKHLAPDVSLSAPQQKVTTSSADQVVLLKETPSDNIGLDGYRFAYELSDGSTREESAQVEARSAEESVLRVRGSYSWVNPADGITYTITYVADENGFQPQGAHLPVAPVA